MNVKVRFNASIELRRPTFSVGVHTTDFLYLTTHTSAKELDLPRLAPGSYEMVCKVTSNPLLPGVYGLRLGITEGIAGRTAFYGENLVHFQVISSSRDLQSTLERTGFFALDAEWVRPVALEEAAARSHRAYAVRT